MMEGRHTRSAMNVSVEKNEGLILAVDLDGTLLKGDLLWESFTRFVIGAPWRVGCILRWGLGGNRALLKANLARHVAIDGSVLPWNQDVVALCSQRAVEGWKIVVATASNEISAKAATAHFSFIDEVIGSDEATNLKSECKAARLEARFGKHCFDYIGDSSADLPVWKIARKGWMVGSPARGRKFSTYTGRPLDSVSPGYLFSWRSLVMALRPHQWLKNLLIFFPLLAAHRWSEAALWRQLGPVFFGVCCVASSSYLLNDLSDLDADRRHARKRDRPLASGRLSLAGGWLTVAALLMLGISLAASSGTAALWATLTYFLLSALYSLALKTMWVVDAVFLSGLYTYRMVLGGIAGSIMISGWLLAFSVTFFLGLAFLKRYVEIVAMPVHSPERLSRRGYGCGDLDFVKSVGLSSSLLSVVVLALYLESAASSALYAKPHWLGATVLALLLWNMRVWFLAGRNRMHDDPVWFAAKDPVTYALCVFCIAVVAFAGPIR